MEYLTLSWVDYALFLIMIGLSTIIGLYFGLCGKQDTTTDYLQGGRQMKIFPVAMSLVASTLSGISLVGVPAEVYIFGTHYWMMIISIFFLGFAVNYIYLPVFYTLQLVSVFEYLEIRFDKKVRTVTSIFFTFVNLIGLPVIIYAPSLAFSQVSGFDVHIVATIMALVCIFYTTIGGIKAVVWTDTVQFCVTLCSLGCVLVMGTISVGGLTTIWEKAERGGRLEFFNMDPDPTLRASFWSVVLGNFFIWTCFIGTSPGIVQRFLAVPTIDHAKKILIVFVIFTILTKSISCFSGLIMYAKYMDCDPLSAGLMKKPDQIVSYYVIDVAGQIPGLSGLFVSGLFSTALSTLSTFLNALSGTMYSDFISPFMPPNTSEKTVSNILKLLTVTTGITSVALIFVVERLGSILQLITSFSGITGGPIFGIFTLGMLIPFANKKGAFCGLLGSALVMSFIILTNQVYIWNGNIRAVMKPLNTHGCNQTLISSLNITTTTTTTAAPTNCAPEEVHWLFRITFYYYMLIGTLLTLIIGAFVSWLTKTNEELIVNPDLLSPCVHRFLPKVSHNKQYETVENALHGLQVHEMNNDIKEIKELLK